MEPTGEFHYVNNLFGGRSRTPMVSTTSHTNLEVMRHLQHAQEQSPRKRTESTNGNRRRRDHLDEMWQGTGRRQVSSAYRMGFAQTPEMQEALREKDYSHHLKRDFIKEYAEAMCKHHTSSRVVPRPAKVRK